jgi:hypothetical protein
MDGYTSARARVKVKKSQKINFLQKWGGRLARPLERARRPPHKRLLESC